MSYTWGRLYLAVDTLISPSSIQHRLYYAYDALATLREPEDFPEELKDKFKEIIDTLTKPKSTDSHTGIKEIIAAMSDDEAYDVAKKILSLYDRITRNKGANDAQSL